LPLAWLAIAAMAVSALAWLAMAAMAVSALTGGGPVRAVLAPLRGAFTAFVSLSDRRRWALHGPAAPFPHVPVGESWLPRFVQRCGWPDRGRRRSASFIL